MFNQATVLEACQKVLSVETSSRTGTVLFESVLKENFGSLKWNKLTPHNQQTVFYTESNPVKDAVDLLCYVNIDTINPSHLSLWSKTYFDPLAITLSKGRIYGLGAAHEKVSFVPMVLAYEKALKKISPDKNIMLVAGYGREFKMRGARRIISEILKRKKIVKTLVANPTENEIHYGSSGRVITKVFFDFSPEEKKLREEHDLRENISSQSKVFNYDGDKNIRGNTVFQLLESCKLLPSGTVLLDLDGGSGVVDEPETTYFEVDFDVPFANSMVTKLSGFSDLLLKLNNELIEMFDSKKAARTIHLGECQDSEEGVYFYGFNLIPPKLSVKELDRWFEEFKGAVKSVGGESSILDARSPYFHPDNQYINENYSLNMTEASFFSKFCKDIVIAGAGKEGFSKMPNESLNLEDLVSACEMYYNLFSEVG